MITARGLVSLVEHRPQARPRQAPLERKEGVSKAGELPYYRNDAEERGRSRGPVDEGLHEPILPIVEPEGRSEGPDSPDASSVPMSVSWNVKPDSMRQTEKFPYTKRSQIWFKDCRGWS